MNPRDRIISIMLSITIDETSFFMTYHIESPSILSIIIILIFKIYNLLSLIWIEEIILPLRAQNCLAPQIIISLQEDANPIALMDKQPSYANTRHWNSQLGSYKFKIGSLIPKLTNYATNETFMRANSSKKLHSNNKPWVNTKKRKAISLKWSR